METLLIGGIVRIRINNVQGNILGVLSWNLHSPCQGSVAQLTCLPAKASLSSTDVANKRTSEVFGLRNGEITSKHVCLFALTLEALTN